MTALAVLGVLGATPGQASAAERAGEFVGKEGKSLAGSKFEGKGTGATVLESVKGVKVTCKSATEQGEIKGTGAKGAVFMEAEEKYKECKNSIGQKCKSAGGAEEEIIIKGVKTSIWAEKEGAGKKLEGLLLKSEITGEVEFKCSTVNQKIKGGALRPVKATQEGVLLTEYEDIATQMLGVQQPVEGLNPATGKKEKVTLEANLANEGFAQAAIKCGWIKKITITISFELR